jgi:predicted nucleotidyltransferase
MKPSEALCLNCAEIRRVIASHSTGNARGFGSVVHGRDTDNSDLDILIDPTPETLRSDSERANCSAKQPDMNP